MKVSLMWQMILLLILWSSIREITLIWLPQEGQNRDGGKFRGCKFNFVGGRMIGSRSLRLGGCLFSHITI